MIQLSTIKNPRRISIKILKKHRNYSINVLPWTLHRQKHSKYLSFNFSQRYFSRRPLWIDSLYGSNNSNLPSIYDDTYARIRRSNATTTDDYHPSSLVPPRHKSKDQINEMTKYSLTDVILEGPSLQDTCVSDSKLSDKHEQKQYQKKSIRRIQSDFNVLSNTSDYPRSTLTETSSINENQSIRKSKSMIEFRSNIDGEEKITAADKIQAEISSPMNIPIPGCQSILQILEHVFADDDDETSARTTEQPESLEPLLNKRSYSNDQRYGTKLIEQQDESSVPTRFRRTHSNQGRRRRRIPRRATCKSIIQTDKLISVVLFF